MIKVLEMLKAKLSRTASEEESGFTLLELMIAVVVIGIITAVSVPVYGAQQRQAMESRLKSDVKSNLSVMATPSGTGRIYADPDTFFATAAKSEGSTILYVVSPSGREACTSAHHEFGPEDVVAFRFLSTVGYIEKGLCPELEGELPLNQDQEPTDPVDTPETPETPEPGNTGDPEDTPAPPPSLPSGLHQIGGIKAPPFDDVYYPQNNNLTWCFGTGAVRMTIEVDLDDPVNIPTPQAYEWQWKFDITKPPFNGLDPYNDITSAFGFQTVSVENGIWTVKGEEWNKIVSVETPREFGFCTRNNPSANLDPAKYAYSITPSPSSWGNWWACVDVVVISDATVLPESYSHYPVPWEIDVDLTHYFQNINGKTPQFINLEATQTGPNRYTITGIGWNRYVSDTMPRTFSQGICYQPGGLAP